MTAEVALPALPSRRREHKLLTITELVKGALTRQGRKYHNTTKPPVCTIFSRFNCAPEVLTDLAER